jgi:hypothetical protein
MAVLVQTDAGKIQSCQWPEFAEKPAGLASLFDGSDFNGSSREPSGNFAGPGFAQFAVQAGERRQRPVLVDVMGVFESRRKMAVVSQPGVNAFLTEFAAILRIACGGGMGFVVDALAKIFRADQVTLVG